MIVVTVLLVLPGCDNSELPFKKILNIPYHAQEQTNYCAVACIQMWADYQGFCPEQDDIADYLGASSGGLYPHQIVDGVHVFTSSWGFLARRQIEPGAQGDLIAGAITGIKRGVPSIMPFEEGIHTVIVRGFEWDEVDNRPIAEVMYYNDPNPWVAETAIMAFQLETHYFTPAQNEYYVILASQSEYEDGILGHNNFVLSGGTYYGGPTFYDPKGIRTPF